MPIQVDLKYLQDLRKKIDKQGFAAFIGSGPPWVITAVCLPKPNQSLMDRFRANLDAAIEMAKKDPTHVWAVIPDEKSRVD